MNTVLLKHRTFTVNASRVSPLWGSCVFYSLPRVPLRFTLG
jgi:hypothetical protein